MALLPIELHSALKGFLCNNACTCISGTTAASLFFAWLHLGAQLSRTRERVQRCVLERIYRAALAKSARCTFPSYKAIYPFPVSR